MSYPVMLNQAKTSRPRPKFLPRRQSGLEALTSLVLSANRTINEKNDYGHQCELYYDDLEISWSWIDLVSKFQKVKCRSYTARSVSSAWHSPDGATVCCSPAPWCLLDFALFIYLVGLLNIAIDGRGHRGRLATACLLLLSPAPIGRRH